MFLYGKDGEWDEMDGPSYDQQIDYDSVQSVPDVKNRWAHNLLDRFEPCLSIGQNTLFYTMTLLEVLQLSFRAYCKVLYI
jgi:hypothetical protein